MSQPVHLENLAAFRKVLQNYHVSPRAQQVLDSSQLVVLSGVAGGGRNTIIDELVKRHNYGFVVSDTTRPPKLRNGVMEVNGVNYYFRSEAEFMLDLRNGEFIEAEIIHNQQVSGTSIRELARVSRTGKIPIGDFEFGGANNVAQAKPDAYIVGLLPPDYDEWIGRINGREKMHQAEFRNRLVTAEKVVNNMLHQPYFKYVINDTVDQCVSDICAIVEQGTTDASQQARCRKIAQQLLEHIQQNLTTTA